jgi:hypothetical protein
VSVRPDGDAEPSERHWDRIYATKPETAVSWFQPELRAEVALIARFAGPAAAVIDVGGGASRLCDELIAAGFRDVTVLDLSGVALAEVAARAPSVARIHADVTTWRPERAYDLWHDRAALHFLVRDADRAGYRRALLAGTRPGSVVILSTFAPEGPDRCSGLPVRRYGAAEMATFLGAVFRTIADLRSDHATPTGTIQRFHTCVARRVA